MIAGALCDEHVVCGLSCRIETEDKWTFRQLKALFDTVVDVWTLKSYNCAIHMYSISANTSARGEQVDQQNYRCGERRCQRGAR